MSTYSFRSIAFVGLLFAGVVLVWSPLSQYVDRKNQEAEKIYYNLGTAMYRIMDPEARRATEAAGAYSM